MILNGEMNSKKILECTPTSKLYRKPKTITFMLKTNLATFNN